jgi:hypothetical protein
MADKNALGLIGLMLGAATVFVTVMGAVAVGRYDPAAEARSGASLIAALPAAQTLSARSDLR